MVNVREAHAFAVELFEQHGQGHWKIRWNRMAGTAGITNYKSQTVTLSARAVEAWDWPLVVELVKHELAHVLVGQGFGHDEVWQAQVKSLGGKPREKCPRFSGPLALFLGRFGEGSNPMFVLILLVSCWVAAPPVGLAVTLALAVTALVTGIRNARPVISAEELAQIEKDVLLK